MFLGLFGGITNTPEPDVAKWPQFTTICCQQYAVTYKIPPAGNYKKYSYKWHKPRVDWADLPQNKDFVGFGGERYDYLTNKDISVFVLNFKLVRYSKPFEKMPDIETFKKLKINDLDSGDYNYTIQTDKLNGGNCIRTTFFTDKEKTTISSEGLLIPLTGEGYMHISTSYYYYIVSGKTGRFDEAYVASRRKIFQEFLNNVTITELDTKDTHPSY